MTTEELYDKLKLIQKMKCETQNLELKSAEQGCPKRLYDSLSSFFLIRMMVALLFLELMRNKIIKKLVFMMLRTFKKKINEQCLQMNPVVRPLITVVEKENKKICFC